MPSSSSSSTHHQPTKMAALSQFLSHLYSMTILFFTILILELVIFIRSLSLHNSDHRRPITTARFLELIEEKSPATRYKAASGCGGGGGLRKMEPIEECTVCLSMLEEGEEIRKLKCNHTFHKVCLDTWLQQDWATCPLCRKTVLPEEIVVRYRQRRNNHDQDYDGSDEELVFLLSALHGNNLHRLL